MGLTIRKTKRIHLIEVLDASCFGSEKILYTDLMNSVWFIAKIDGVVVGYAGIRIVDGVTGYLSRAGVIEGFRGKGIQSKLIRARERWAKKQGLRSLITYTSQSAIASPNSLISSGFKLYKPARPWVDGTYQWLYWRKEI